MDDEEWTMKKLGIRRLDATLKAKTDQNWKKTKSDLSFKNRVSVGLRFIENRSISVSVSVSCWALIAAFLAVVLIPGYRKVLIFFQVSKILVTIRTHIQVPSITGSIVNAMVV
jgi:hypothetical protein